MSSVEVGAAPPRAETAHARSNQNSRKSLASALSSWAYSGESGRDLRIDLLRGLAVLAMVIDHIAGPSKLYLISGGNQFYTSAAEGFIFLSGLTVGLVYRHIAERQGLAIALRRLLARAWNLYLLAIGLTLVLLPVSEMLRLPWAVGIEESSPLQVVWAVLSLHQTYYLVDVLALYVVLMLAAPLAQFLMHDGRTWVLVMLSWLIWAGFQFFPRQSELPWTTDGNNLFHLSAWQVLFFTAMVIGYHRQRLARLLPRVWQLHLLTLTGLGFAVLVAVYMNQSAVLDALQSALVAVSVGPGWSVADLQDALLAKGDVRVWRVLASSVVFAFLFQLTNLVWVPIRRIFGWLLLALGQNALYAYSLHIVVAVVLAMLSTYTTLGGDARSNAAIQLASIGLIWIGIRFRIVYPSAENIRYWKMSVVPLIAATVVLFRVDPAPAVAVAETVPVEPTPISDAVRHARAFGTPVPRIPGVEPGMRVPATPEPSPIPTPMPLPQAAPSNVATSAEPSGAAYVGPISGSFRELVFYSPSLDRDMSYYIYLPPGYATEGRRYPVLYMLHGGGGNKDEWLAYGLIDDVDRSILSKDIKPMIVVVPQGIRATGSTGLTADRYGAITSPTTCARRSTRPSARCRTPPTGPSADCRWAGLERSSSHSIILTCFRKPVHTALHSTSTTARFLACTAPVQNSSNASRSIWPRTRRISRHPTSGLMPVRTIPGSSATLSCTRPCSRAASRTIGTSSRAPTTAITGPETCQRTCGSTTAC